LTWPTEFDTSVVVPSIVELVMITGAEVAMVTAVPWWLATQQPEYVPPVVITSGPAQTCEPGVAGALPDGEALGLEAAELSDGDEAMRATTTTRSASTREPTRWRESKNVRAVPLVSELPVNRLSGVDSSARTSTGNWKRRFERPDTIPP